MPAEQTTKKMRPSKTAANRYAAMAGDREPYLIRARRLAGLTIPSLYRLQGSNGSTETPAAWQSFGAYCVNSLTSKLTLTVFPPGISPLRLDPSRQTIQDLLKLGGDEKKKGDLKLAIDKGLRATELEFTAAITQDCDSTLFSKALKYEIVGGNFAFKQYPDASWQGFTLDQFVCLRDGQGNLLEWIIEENLVWDTLPQDVQDYLKDVRPVEDDPDVNGGKRPAEKIPLYTHGKFGQDGKWHIYQEACEYHIPNTEWTWAKEALPYIFDVWNLLPGEHYARSYCEDYESDLQGLDGGEEILTEGTAAAALLVRMVKPGGVTSKEALAKARNGAVITGDVNDVSTVQANKQADFMALEKRVDIKEQRLAKAFLLDVAVQRDAERVTAEEIRRVSQALNDQLGSLYLEKVKSFQMPWCKLKMGALQRNKRMTPLPPSQVDVQMATGAAALSRNAELQNLDDLTMPPNPVMQQQAARYIDSGVYYRRRATKLGIDQDGLIKTDDQLAQEDQQAHQQAMMQQATPNLVKGGADIIGKNIDHSAAIEQNAQQAQIAQQASTQGTPA